MSEIKGKLEKLVLNTTSKKTGKPIHGFVVNGQSLTIGLHNEYGQKVGGYLSKMKVGDDIIVTINDQYGSVSKVSSGAPKTFGGSSWAKKSFAPKKEYDATGSIQGMVLNNAVQVVIGEKVKVTPESLITAAKIILEAKGTIDKLVVDALGKSDKKETSDFSGLDEDLGETKIDNFDDIDPF